MRTRQAHCAQTAAAPLLLCLFTLSAPVSHERPVLIVPLRPILEVPPAFAAHGLLLPRGPFAATLPQPAPQRLSTHGLPPSRRGIKHECSLVLPARCPCLGRLFLLSEMPFPLPSPWSIPSVQLVSGATLSRKPSWIFSLSQLFAWPSTISLSLADEPSRQRLAFPDPVPNKWAFLQPCPGPGAGPGTAGHWQWFSRVWRVWQRRAGRA